MAGVPPPQRPWLKIISGGQTGVDRAALDVALELGIPCGGWCPAGRWAEDGPIATRYPLVETPSAEPEQRTLWNVRDADRTLILYRGRLSGGTSFTRDAALRLGRPVELVNLRNARAAEAPFVSGPGGSVGVLNVAGPRESEEPGIHEEAAAFLRLLLRRIREAATCES